MNLGLPLPLLSSALTLFSLFCWSKDNNTALILIVSLHLMDLIQGGRPGPVSVFIAMQSGDHV